MSELHVTYAGQRYSFQPGATVRIGRSSDNDIVISDPTVSRRHAHLTFEASGWVWQNAGQAATFLRGQPVARFSVSQPIEVSLAAPQGPAVRLEQAAQVREPTEIAGPYAAPPPAGASPAAAPAGAAAAAAAANAAPAAAAAQQGAPWQPAGSPDAPWQPAAQQQAAWRPGGPPVGAPPPGTPMPAGWQPGALPPGAAPPADLGGSLHILIPIRSWLTNPGWRQGRLLLMIPYAILPLTFIGLFSMSGNLTTPGWAYSLYVAPLWLLAFWYLIRPGRVGLQELYIAIGIIIFTVIWLNAVTGPTEGKFASGNFNLPKALVVGYDEEITKALPVLVAAMLLLKFGKKKLDPRMWMWMGTVAGLTFGVVEQSRYTPLAIVGIHMATQNNQAVVATLLFAFRVFVDGFQHAVWAGVAGFFVGMAVNYRRRRIPLLLLGISIPAILHALNDWTLTIFNAPWAAVLIQTFSLLLFLGYALSAATIERDVRRNPVFRGESMLMDRFSETGGQAGP